MIIVAALAATVANAEDYVFNMKNPLGCEITLPIINFKFDKCTLGCPFLALAGCSGGKCNTSGDDEGKCTCTCNSDPNDIAFIDIPQNVVNALGGKWFNPPNLNCICW